MRTCGYCGREEVPSTTCTTSTTLSIAADRIDLALKATETALGLFHGPDDAMEITLLGMIADSLAKDATTIDSIADSLHANRNRGMLK